MRPCARDICGWSQVSSSSWTFSPSIGTPLFFYQTDTLQFSQPFIGMLASLSSIAAIMGALAYAGLSRRVAL